MPKLLTARRVEGETEKAREYVRSHILLPSSLLGLVFMLSGMGFQYAVYSMADFGVCTPS